MQTHMQHAQIICGCTQGCFNVVFIWNQTLQRAQRGPLSWRAHPLTLIHCLHSLSLGGSVLHVITKRLLSPLFCRVICKLLASKSESIRVQALKVLGYFLKHLGHKSVSHHALCSPSMPSVLSRASSVGNTFQPWILWYLCKAPVVWFYNVTAYTWIT